METAIFLIVIILIILGILLKDKMIILFGKNRESKRTFQNEEEVTSKEEEAILEQLKKDDLMLNFAMKYPQISLILNLFAGKGFATFKIFRKKEFIMDDDAKGIANYNLLINSMNSETVNSLETLESIDYKSIDNFTGLALLIYEKRTHKPAGYDIIKEDFISHCLNDEIFQLYKLSQLINRKYENLKTKLFFSALYQLAVEKLKNDIRNDLSTTGSREAYLTYYLDENPYVFDNNLRYWAKALIKLNAEVLYENGMLINDTTSNFIEQLKAQKKENELNAFERQLTDVKNINFSINDVDLLTGIEFEHFVGGLLEKMGYSAKVTKSSGDQGADLIAKKNNLVTVVQAKCYSGSVSNKAIQEVVASIKHYNADGGMVITNSTFTKSAMVLADSNDIKLIDRNRLIELMDRY